jgi:hypothetical protein
MVNNLRLTHKVSDSIVDSEGDYSEWLFGGISCICKTDKWKLS